MMFRLAVVLFIIALRWNSLVQLLTAVIIKQCSDVSLQTQWQDRHVAMLKFVTFSHKEGPTVRKNWHRFPHVKTKNCIESFHQSKQRNDKPGQLQMSYHWINYVNENAFCRSIEACGGKLGRSVYFYILCFFPSCFLPPRWNETSSPTFIVVMGLGKQGTASPWDTAWM